ncbi:MAG: hypothetical protein M0T77_06840 [Actinomycetota bacterium]|nr:hypothetical protein [Actinomycetota bacterium]
MVYAPGHFRELSAPRARRRAERLSMRLAALVAVALAAVVIFSLSSHPRRVGRGCISFTYTTMIGGGQMYKCGELARKLCASPSSTGGIDANFVAQLDAACRRAHLRTVR